MNGLNRTIMIISLIAEILCLIGSIWMSTILKDAVSYLIIIIFAGAVIATTVTLLKSKE